jgi:large subunit ribosomal protein L7/L12
MAEEKKEAAAEAKAETKVPAKFASLVKSIEEMTVADLAEFVKILEDKFGVSAAAPMMMAGAPAAAGATEAVEEKTSFTVMLKDGGAQKIAVIKAVREINQDLGLVDAKNLVEAAPKEVKKDLPKDEAEEAKKKLEAAGATVELV